MEDSLNSGVELEDELAEQALHFDDVLFKDPAFGSVPEVDTDTTIMTQVAKVQDLGYLSADMSRAGGMDQSFALEAERVMPGFLNAERPLGFFTQHKTATLYKVSMEELEVAHRTAVMEVWWTLAQYARSTPGWLMKLQELLKKNNAGKSVFTQKATLVQSQLEVMHKAYTTPELVKGSLGKLLESETDTKAVENFIELMVKHLATGEEQVQKLYAEINKSAVVNQLVDNAELAKRVFDQCAKIAPAFKTLQERLSLSNLLIDDVPMQAIATQAGVIQSIGGFDQVAEANSVALATKSRDLDAQEVDLKTLFTQVVELIGHPSVQSFLANVQAIHDQADQVTTDFGNGNDTTPEMADPQAQALSALYKSTYDQLRGMNKLVVQTGGLFSALIWVGTALHALIDQLRGQVVQAVAPLSAESQKLVLQYFHYVEDEPQPVEQEAEEVMETPPATEPL